MSRKLALAGAGLALALAAAELSVRLIRPQANSWLAIYRTHPDLPVYSVEADLEQFVDTGESAWTVITDRTGNRSAPASLRRPIAPGGDIWVMGDSFTFGNSVDHERTFVGLLDAAAGPGTGLVNAATPGYGPVQYLMRLEHRLSQRPKPRAVLLLPYLGNDFQDTLWEKPVDPGAGRTAEPMRPKDLAKRHLHLYRLAAKVWHRLRPRREDRVARVLFSRAAWEGPFLSRAEERFGDTMAAIVALCRSHSVPVALGLIPPEHTVRDEAASDPDHDVSLPVTRARARLADLDVQVVDLTAALRAVGADRAFWPLDGHLSPAGHRAVAEALAPLVAALLSGRDAPQSSPR